MDTTPSLQEQLAQAQALLNQRVAEVHQHEQEAAKSHQLGLQQTTAAARDFHMDAGLAACRAQLEAMHLMDEAQLVVDGLREQIEAKHIAEFRRPAALPLGLTKRVTAEVIPFPSISFDHSPEAA